VRNLSSVASANQTRVDLSWSVWGIGMPRQGIGTTFVDLTRAGFPGSQQTISWPLPTALNTAGLYGIFVNLQHPYDRNKANNQGEQTVDGFQTSTGRGKTFVVPISNPSGTTQTIALSAGPASVASWVTITPAVLTLAAGAQQNVMVGVNVPASVPASPAGTEISATIETPATRAAGTATTTPSPTSWSSVGGGGGADEQQTAPPRSPMRRPTAPPATAPILRAEVQHVGLQPEPASVDSYNESWLPVRAHWPRRAPGVAAPAFFGQTSAGARVGVLDPRVTARRGDLS
jgi:hypothetical protein